MSFLIRRGQSVRWRLTMMAQQSPVNMAGGTWGTAETTFKVPPTFENSGSEAWVIWPATDTQQMTAGRKRLRLKFTQANGEVKVFPDLYVTVQ